jgi:tRNA1Val (adenine37-N6)-methyltransferase
MGNSWFQFQEFRVEQDQCAMKISTDAVLLGSLAIATNPQKILDVGTGTGVIALMLGQRFAGADIQAVELDHLAAKQARFNFENSPFANRLVLWEGRFQDFQILQKFDLIVSNPPYFSDHLKSPDAQRNLALHTDGLPFVELIHHVSIALASNGTFWVILPPRQMLDLEKIALRYSLYPSKRFTIQDNPVKPIMREILGFGWKKEECFTSQIIIKEESGEFHNSYKALISGFLLNF